MTQDNEKFARFMGGKRKSEVLPEIAKHMDDDDIWLPLHGIRMVNLLEYHSSWDWLMPVVEKIESTPFTNNLYSSTGYNVIINGWEVVIQEDPYTVLVHVKYKHSSSKIDAVYKAVLQFIEWYEKQKGL